MKSLEFSLGSIASYVKLESFVFVLRIQTLVSRVAHMSEALMLEVGEVEKILESFSCEFSIDEFVFVEDCLGLMNLNRERLKLALEIGAALRRSTHDKANLERLFFSDEISFPRPSNWPLKIRSD